MAAGGAMGEDGGGAGAAGTAAGAGAGAGAGPPGGGSRLPRMPQKHYEPVQLPTAEMVMASQFWENCAVKAGVSGVVGGLMGLVLGPVFGLGALDPHVGSKAVAEQRTTQQIVKDAFKWQNIKAGAKSMGGKSLSYGKTFGYMGLLFAGGECMVEKYRAKHDIYNGVIGGCFAGAAMSYQAGPTGMCMGCAGFAAFSALFEKLLDPH